MEYSYSKINQDRLPFVLPDFTRITWTSDTAKRAWEPRLINISEAWKVIEWASIIYGVRKCNLIRLSPQSLIKKGSQLAAYNLSILPLELEGINTANYSSSSQEYKQGMPYVFPAVIGKIEYIHQFQKAWQTKDHMRIGALLGYPKCCQHFFQNIWGKNIDTTWAMALNTKSAKVENQCISVRGVHLSNILWRWMGVRAVPHLPCSFSCTASITFAQRFREVGLKLGFKQAMNDMNTILKWPVEWNALHGIAEIRTPILKVSTRTDATRSKFVVQKRGSGYPMEGASGLSYPYLLKNKSKLTQSPSFKRGLKNKIHPIGNTYPEWFHTDNGFHSLQVMKHFHRPIIENVKQILAENATGNSTILDLGCGNGALLKNFKSLNPKVSVYGIDLNKEHIAHAKTLHPEHPNQFIVGNAFNFPEWQNALPNDFTLMLCMAGRLTEVPRQKALESLQWMQKTADSLLFYMYPDWTRHSSIDDILKQFEIFPESIPQTSKRSVNTTQLAYIHTSKLVL